MDLTIKDVKGIVKFDVPYIAYPSVYLSEFMSKKKNSESAIKAISADFKTEKAKTEAPAQKKAKAIGISHFDTAVNSENEFTEDANDKY